MSLPRLRPIPISELRALEQGKRWQVDQPIPDLETLTPVRGVVEAMHHGTALEVSGEVEAIITLCCARCLQPFNYPLRAEVSELIEFRGGPNPDDSLVNPLGEDLDDRLDPQGRFDPERWVFEQLSLRLPLVNRCGDDCPGPSRWSSAAASTDPRWAALKTLTPPPSTAPPSQAPTTQLSPPPPSPN
ncbi:MAG: DUF177 domain-containing protein [Cyanobacteriota bacterium]|nr:DUF177 domain-containing protein [Cyanobacteriota bacterium]